MLTKVKHDSRQLTMICTTKSTMIGFAQLFLRNIIRRMSSEAEYRAPDSMIMFAMGFSVRDRRSPAVLWSTHQILAAINTAMHSNLYAICHLATAESICVSLVRDLLVQVKLVKSVMTKNAKMSGSDSNTGVVAGARAILTSDPIPQATDKSTLPP